MKEWCMDSGVGRSWDVIVAWLAGNAPAVRASVRPPAAAENVLEAERRLGIGLPVDLRAWWQRADGQEDFGRLVLSYRPYSVLEALNSRDVWLSAWNGVMQEVAAEMQPPVDFAAWVARENRAPAGSPCNSAWLPSWLPIAGDGGGDDLFVDLRPGPAHGCVRAFRRDAGASDDAWWGGVAEMLADIAAALTLGGSIQGYRVQVEADGRMWWDNDELRRAAAEERVRNQAIREWAKRERER
jgi:cell wall assembly regulator SMI1